MSKKTKSLLTKSGKAVTKTNTAKDVSREKRRMATAYHEAGHAVVYWSRNRPFEYVTIKPGEGSLGHVKGFEHTFKDGWVYVDALLCTLAGNVAEKRLTGRSNNVGARSDFFKAIDYARGADPLSGGYAENDPLPQYLVKGAFKQLDIIISWWWPAITAVAEALLERETLTESEVIEILNLDSVRGKLREAHKDIHKQRERQREKELAEYDARQERKKQTAKADKRKR
jgi:hypothetical protein